MRSAGRPQGRGSFFATTTLPLFIITWSSLVGAGASTRTRFLFTVARKSQSKQDGSSMRRLWEVLGWSFSVILSVEPLGHDRCGRRLDGSQTPILRGSRGCYARLVGAGFSVTCSFSRGGKKRSASVGFAAPATTLSISRGRKVGLTFVRGGCNQKTYQCLLPGW